MIKIDDIQLKIIKDSRGEDTLEAAMNSGSISVASSIPKGKSRGEREVYLTNIPTALQNFNKIKSAILKREYNSLIDFDDYLIEIDGSKNKSNLGGNLTLVLSQAFVRLAAEIQGLRLWQYLRKELLAIAPELKNILNKNSAPYFFFNLINGGQHALYGPKIQEYLIMPKIDSPQLALEIGELFFAGLKEYFLKEYGEIKFGDEGGLLIPENDFEKPLEIFKQVRMDLKLEKEIGFGLDVAASSFYNEETKAYDLLPAQIFSSEKLLEIYKEFNKKYNLVFLEDPFQENDFEHFAQLSVLQSEREPSCVIVGDDLTTTNTAYIDKAIKAKAVSGVIIKPSQAGTISEVLRAIALCHNNNVKIIISHRSAETLDDFIADLAMAAGAWGLKAGAPQPEERMTKYQRIIQILRTQIKILI